LVSWKALRYSSAAPYRRPPQHQRGDQQSDSRCAGDDPERQFAKPVHQTDDHGLQERHAGAGGHTDDRGEKDDLPTASSQGADLFPAADKQPLVPG
jgi:hypothetical protein